MSRPLCPHCVRQMSRQLDGHGWICLPCGAKFDTTEDAERALAANPLASMGKIFADLGNLGGQGGKK